MGDTEPALNITYNQSGNFIGDNANSIFNDNSIGVTRFANTWHYPPHYRVGLELNPNILSCGLY